MSRRAVPGRARPAATPLAARSLAALSFAALAAVAMPACAAPTAAAANAPIDTLGAFRAWLEGVRPGYRCDEGPAPFRNAKVAAAYPGARFYYVFTHTTGIPPRVPNTLTLVARVDSAGGFQRLGFPGVETYQAGLRRIRSSGDARTAAAAMLVLALGDPAERRFPIHERSVRAKKVRGAWVCTYAHGEGGFVSKVEFDKKGRVRSVQCNPPPVP